MTRHNQHIGKAGEEWAASSLRSLGVCMVERIATPVKIVPGRAPIWGEPVSGDFRGVLPGGRSVLVECKTILDRNLRYSDLREHQPDRLTEHAQLGGLSLLVWVHQSGVMVMRWPVPGFVAGTGITPLEAEILSVRKLG